MNPNDAMLEHHILHNYHFAIVSFYTKTLMMGTYLQITINTTVHNVLLKQNLSIRHQAISI